MKSDLQNFFSEREKNSRMIFVESNDGILIHDIDGNIIEANTKIQEMFGSSKSELLTKKLNDFYPPDMVITFQTALEKLSNYDCVRFEAEFREKNGGFFPAEVSAYVFNINGNKVYQSFIRNITESKQADINIQNSEQLYRTIFQTSPEFISITDNDGNFLDANRSMLNRMELTLAEFQQTKFFDFFSGDNLSKIKEAFKQLLNEKKVTGLVVQAMTPEGKLFDYELDAIPLKENGQVTKILTIARDITERKLLEFQLRQSQKLETVGRLAGGIAHDFNNLLTVINGFSDFLLKDIPQDNPLRPDIEAIYNAGQKAADLTRHLLAFSRRQIFDLQTLDLNEIIRNLSKMLHRIIGDNIKLETRFCQDLGKIKVDPGQIEQVILNILVNARDALPQGGVINIETDNVEIDQEYSQGHLFLKPGSYVLISISDTGSGMSKEIQQQVFEPFFTTKESGKGTGLGLSTVYGIVKQSKGYIWVYSEPNIGSCFKIYLPRVDKTKEKISPPQNIKGTETILLVEDSSSVRSILRKILERNGYSILEAKNGEEAIQIFEKNQSDVKLLLSDVIMPGINGKELSERIISINTDIKFLLMSGYTDDSTVLIDMLKGGIPFLQKPVIPDKLTKKVREVLDS